ncbi:hypothetical protein GCM10023065_23850 [Microbacterium laevaniformans]|nr:hypothetical protein GCM10017578_23480 [Microbacterium laevaniformans]
MSSRLSRAVDVVGRDTRAAADLARPVGSRMLDEAKDRWSRCARKRMPTKLCTAGARAGVTDSLRETDSKLRALAPELFCVACDVHESRGHGRRSATAGCHIHIKE